MLMASGTQTVQWVSEIEEGSEKDQCWDLQQLSPSAQKQIPKNVKRSGVTSESYVTSVIELEECKISELEGPLELKK